LEPVGVSKRIALVVATENVVVIGGLGRAGLTAVVVPGEAELMLLQDTFTSVN